jgi:senataxin
MLIITPVKILTSIFRQIGTASDAQKLTMHNILDTRSSDIVDIAYGDAKWNVAKDTARALLLEILSADIEKTKKTIISLSRCHRGLKAGESFENLPPFSIRLLLWRMFYASIKETRDTTAILDLIRITSEAAQVDLLKPSVFTACKSPTFFKLVDDVNLALRTIQDGMLTAISSFAECCISTNWLDVLSSPGAGRCVTLLILSPISDFHMAGVTLVSLAFDVDGRMECFKVLLENLPDQTLDGMFGFLRVFQEYVVTLVEACSLSTTLVRCFGDVLDVLCLSPGGLLHNPLFLRPEDKSGPAARLPEFWKLLTRSLSRIYNRCPLWAEYIDVPDMVIWMRDALILARDALKQWRVLEAASNAYAGAPVKSTSDKISPLGRKMVDSLQEFLTELARWLRLTDEELLHQAFSLLQSLLETMKAVDTKPSEAALKKLLKYVERTRLDKDTSQSSSRLDKGRLLQLSEALAYFMDDEVEIVDVEPISKASNTVAPRVDNPQTKTSQHTITSGTKSVAIYPQSRVRTGTSATGPRLGTSDFVPSSRRFVLTPTTSTSKALDVPVSHSKAKNEALNRAPESEESDTSDSDSEDTSGGTSLASLGKFVKSPRKPMSKPKRVERRRVIALDIPSVTNGLQDRLMVMRNRQVRNTALRLRPDISGLHKVILSWDYNFDGPGRPGENGLLSHVPDRFDSYEHYFRVFQPLLLSECWSQLRQAKDEVRESYQCQVNGRQFTDDWLDIDITITESVKKGWYLAETDIVLLHQLGHKKCIMAKVKTYKTLPTGILSTVRCYTRAGLGDPGLQITTFWQINKVFRCVSICFRISSKLMFL